MSAILVQHVNADELWKMGDIGRCELIFGEIVMMSPAGFSHGEVAIRIGSYLREFVDEHGLGVVVAAETGYRLENDLVRAPDASFVKRDRIPAEEIKAFFPGAPDLAVEVVSYDDAKKDVINKANMWLAHGTSVVWIADPKAMTLTIYRVGKSPERLSSTEEIKDEPVLPGFVLSLSKIFRRP